jgi:succinate dehydrogenase / fumarate reductase cytochrome b subunit
VLWGVRAVLVVAAAVHVVTAIGLTWRAWEARPVGYARRRYVATGLGARSMPYGGLALLLFVGYHLAHLTAGYAWGLGYQHPPLDAQGRPDVYQNVVASFRVGWCAGAYLLAQLCLALHLQHGAWSVLQSLGLSHPRYNESLRSAAAAIALGACVGFAAVPVAVYFGLVPVE